MKIRPVEAELLYEEKRTEPGGYDEANSRFFAILRKRLKSISSKQTMSESTKLNDDANALCYHQQELAAGVSVSCF